MYVWVDALTNYITATGFPDDGPRAEFWPADVHVIGKDITRFHAIYWPAFLMSAGLPLPKQIVVHGFLFNRGEKMSKSVGNVVEPGDLVDAYGLDPVRYFFLREVPFGQDGNYSHEAIVAAHERRSRQRSRQSGAALADDDRQELRRRTPDWREAAPTARRSRDARPRRRAGRRARRHMQSFPLHLYIGAVFEVVAEANRYFANAEPWKLAKSDPERMRARALCDDGDAAHRRDPAAARDAGVDGRAAGPARRPRRGREFAALDASDRGGQLAAPGIGSSRAGRSPRRRPFSPLCRAGGGAVRAQAKAGAR